MIIRLLDTEQVYENELPEIEEVPETILFGERVYVWFCKNLDGKETYRRSTSIQLKRVTLENWSGGVDRYTKPVNRLEPKDYRVGPTIRREDVMRGILGFDPAKPGEDKTGYAKVQWIDGSPVKITPLTPAERFRLETEAKWPSAEELDKDRVFPSTLVEEGRNEQIPRPFLKPRSNLPVVVTETEETRGTPIQPTRFPSGYPCVPIHPDAF